MRTAPGSRAPPSPAEILRRRSRASRVLRRRSRAHRRKITIAGDECKGMCRVSTPRPALAPASAFFSARRVGLVVLSGKEPVWWRLAEMVPRP
jgi:hypothetical protein